MNKTNKKKKKKKVLDHFEYQETKEDVKYNTYGRDGRVQGWWKKWKDMNEFGFLKFTHKS
jgi:hypothetical protein